MNWTSTGIQMINCSKCMRTTSHTTDRDYQTGGLFRQCAYCGKLEWLDSAGQPLDPSIRVETEAGVRDNKVDRPSIYTNYGNTG